MTENNSKALKSDITAEEFVKGVSTGEYDKVSSLEAAEKFIPELMNREDDIKDGEEVKIYTSVSSHQKDGMYYVLTETNPDELETWYYFIRQENNEEAIQKLKETIDSVNEPCYVDDMSVFYLDTENLVSAQTAKEMSKIDVNSYQFHRKYDGILKFDKISFKLKKKDKDKRKLEKIFDKLGYGKIDDYISDEDIDTDDLGSSSESESESDSDTGSGSGSGSVSESDDSSLKVLVPDKLPAGLKNRDIPNWARTKSKKRGEKK